MTMIELLTVVVVLGTLMAIAVPAFYHHRDRARDASAQASARAAQTAAIEIGQENEGEYDGPDGITHRQPESRRAQPRGGRTDGPVGAVRELHGPDPVRDGNTFDIRQNNDGTVDLRASADDAGCPSDGTWD